MYVAPGLKNLDGQTWSYKVAIEKNGYFCSQKRALVLDWLILLILKSCENNTIKVFMQFITNIISLLVSDFLRNTLPTSENQVC